MPKQEFVFSYLLYPQDYTKEVIGVSIPLSFIPVDGDGDYVFNYLPFDIHEGIYMNRFLLAERRYFHDSTNIQEQLFGERNKSLSFWVHQLVPGERQKENIAVEHSTIEADNSRKIIGKIHSKFMLAENLDVYGMKHFLPKVAGKLVERKEASKFDLASLAARPYRHEALYETCIHAVREKWLKDSTIGWHTLAAILTERHGAVFRSALLADELTVRLADAIRKILLIDKHLWREGQILFDTDGGKRQSKEGKALHIVYKGVRWLQESAILKKVIPSVRDARSANIIKNILYVVKEWKDSRRIFKWRFGNRDGHGASRRVLIKWADKEYHGASRLTRLVYGILKHQEAHREYRWQYAESKINENLEGYIEHPVILAHFHSPEAAIYQALLEFEKAGVLGEVLEAIVGDVKVARDSRMLDDFLADGKAGADSWIDREAFRISVNPMKKAREMFVSALNIGFVKREHDSRWIERLLLSVLSDTTRQAIIDRIAQRIAKGKKVNKKTILQCLKEAEVPDPEGLLLQLEQGWNKDKPNRPAGIMNDLKSGWWDIGWDDLIDLWGDGWDYLDVPERDYDYAKHIPEVYDENGVPLDPLGPINKPDVDVKMPVTHPLKEWDGIGNEEAWVEIFTYQDVLLAIAGIFKRDTAKFAGMTGHQAMQYIIRELKTFLESSTPWDAQYKRMFRFVRWYAEHVAMKESVTVLHRIYEDWHDNILLNGGAFDPETPHTKSYMEPTPLGTIESTSTAGYFEFSKENYIDGQFTLSAVIATSNPDSTSKIELYIDDMNTPVYTFTAGPAQRLSFDVPMGRHTYRIAYQTEVGDVAKISGLQISGVKFVEAYTTQRDNGEVRGMKAVDNLIQMLLSYYMKHHQGKKKGAMDVKQRKIWLT